MDLPWGFYLGWDWPWLVFFIILGLSVALAMVVKGWQVLWVIPALVLYGGLLWGIPGGWSFLFKFVFWVAVIVAVATALLPGRTRLARVPMYLMIGLIVWCVALWMMDDVPGWDTLWWILGLALLVGLVVLVFATKIGAAIIAVVLAIGLLNLSLGLMFDTEREVANPPAEDVCLTIEGEYDPETQDEVPTGYEVDAAKDCAPEGDHRANGDGEEEEPAVCPARFRQDLDPNRHFRFVSEGFEGTAKQKRRQLIMALGHDYRYLDFVAEQLFRRPIANRSLVTDGRKCLSEKGRTLHAKVEGALMASGIKTGTAPRDGFNTGVRDGQPVVDKRRGVYGDRKATIYTLADGTRLVVLDRCGNVVLKKKPQGMSEGPTDNPQPPQQPEQPQQPNQPPSGEGGCVEIPGNGVYDCGGKHPEQEPAQQGNVPDNVTGKNPGTGGEPASQPSAQPSSTYTAPSAPSSDSSESEEAASPPPPKETSAPAPDDPEPSPTQDPCEVNPDWC